MLKILIIAGILGLVAKFASKMKSLVLLLIVVAVGCYIVFDFTSQTRQKHNEVKTFQTIFK